MPTDLYKRQKRHSRKKSAEGSDIGEIPPIADPERRESCRLDLHKFLTTYFPRSTSQKPFSADHLRAISRLQSCILVGGLFVQAFPRGFAKTTISENAALWAVIYGHRKFVPIFGADAASAHNNINSIQTELSENDLLYADFPEVCHAVRALEGKAQRCASQTVTVGPCEECTGGKTDEDGDDCPACEGSGWNRQRTHMGWRADTVVLPTIPGSEVSGAIITARGIMGGCRGMKHKRPDGTQQRPDFVILDDPQTDESAATDLQVEKRLDIIRKSILKLGGHDRKIAVVMNATVIKPNDLVERLLDPKRFPSWQGERIKMVRTWSEAHETLWLGDYARLRNTYDPEQLGDQQRAHRDATDFYRRNRAKMDAACEVAWEYCYNDETELSAIQHAYNLLIDDGPDVFASECQNEPLNKEEEGEEYTLKAEQVAAKTNGFDRGVIPLPASRLVVFVDVQKDALFWTAAAFGTDFSGWVVDYNTFPEQRGRTYFSLRDVRQTLAKVTKGQSLEECIYSGLDILVGNLMAREWRREDGTSLKPERIMVDANWGPSTDVVDKFCRQSQHASVLLASHGHFVGATSRPFNQYKPKVGERVGHNWRISASSKRQARFVLFDTNAWKTFTMSRLKVGMGGKGCLSLWGDSPDAHRMFADHVTAETPIEVEAKGRKVIEWKIKPSRPDNHYLDCLVGCGVAASVQGVSLKELEHHRTVVKKIKLSDLQKQKANRNG